MSIARARYVTCDRCGDPAEIVVEGATVARHVARSQGFICNRSGDWCGRCWPDVADGWVFQRWAEPGGADQDRLVESVTAMATSATDGEVCWVQTRWGVAWFQWSDFDREQLHATQPTAKEAR